MPWRLMGKWTNSNIHCTVTDGSFTTQRCTFDPKKKNPFWTEDHSGFSGQSAEYAKRVTNISLFIYIGCPNNRHLSGSSCHSCIHHVNATVPLRHLQAWMFHASGIILYTLQIICYFNLKILFNKLDTILQFTR